jgi:hypothetical protein
MSQQQPPDGGIPQDRYDLPEKALGGADAVPDTSYVPAAEPEHPKGEGPVKARVPAGSGQGATWAIIAFLVIGAVLVFLLGFGQ